MYLLLSDVIDLLYEYTATGTPSPKELTLCTCYCLSQLSNLFFWRRGGGQVRGEDLIDIPSQVVAVLTFICMYMPASGWRCLIVD